MSATSPKSPKSRNKPPLKAAPTSPCKSLAWDYTDVMSEESERLKDLMYEPERRTWPRVLGFFVLIAAAGVGYWFYLPAAERPDLTNLAGRMVAWVRQAVNTPIVSSSAPPESGQPAAPTSDSIPPKTPAPEPTSTWP